MFFVYVINSFRNYYIYVGLTNNLSRRLQQHNEGREQTTAPYRPFTLVHKEVYATRVKAREREKYLKSGCGKEWLKKQFLKK